MNKERLEYGNPDLKTSLIFPLYLCSKEVTRRYNQVLSEFDITYTQYLVLMYFFNEKESNLKRIGDVLLLDSSTLTPLLKKLEQKKLISRKKLKKDGRNLIITLTKKGKDLENKLNKIPSMMKDEVGLDDDEIDVMYDLILKVLLNIRKDDNKCQ